MSGKEFSDAQVSGEKDELQQSKPRATMKRLNEYESGVDVLHHQDYLLLIYKVTWNNIILLRRWSSGRISRIFAIGIFMLR